MKEAWLHRRALKAGVLDPNVPLYVFSDTARDAVVDLFNVQCRTIEGLQEMSKYAVFPCNHFACEIEIIGKTYSARTETTTEQKQRLLFDVSYLFNDDLSVRIDAVVFAKSDRRSSGLQVVAGMLAVDNEGWTLPSVYEDAFDGDFGPVEKLREFYEQFDIGLSFPRESQREAMPALIPRIKEGLSACATWLLCATAVIATPGLPREEGRARGPEPKVRQRGATAKAPEFAYTRISLDIDRTVSGGEKAQEAEARKLALHRVRAHLRFIKDKGLVPVRAHMRGNAAHGVRIGRTLVHKGGN